MVRDRFQTAFDIRHLVLDDHIKAKPLGFYHRTISTLLSLSLALGEPVSCLLAGRRARQAALTMPDTLAIKPSGVSAKILFKFIVRPRFPSNRAE